MHPSAAVLLAAALLGAAPPALAGPATPSAYCAVDTSHASDPVRPLLSALDLRYVTTVARQRTFSVVLGIGPGAPATSPLMATAKWAVNVRVAGHTYTAGRYGTATGTGMWYSFEGTRTPVTPVVTETETATSREIRWTVPRSAVAGARAGRSYCDVVAMSWVMSTVVDTLAPDRP